MPINSDPSFRGYQRTNTLAIKLKDAIEAGGQKNREEWADEFHVTTLKVSQSLTWLRKHGHLYYPVNIKTGKKGNGGVLVNIMKSQEFIRQTMNRHDINYLAPQLESISRIIEQSVTKFPHLAPLFQSFLLDKASRLSIIKETINGNLKLANKKN